MSNGFLDHATALDPAGGHWLETSSLRRGEMIELTWFPDRECVIRCLGGDRWEVVDSVATRLKAGQQFRCSHIIAGEALQISLEPSELVARPMTYVCGRQRDVRFRRL